MKPEPTLNEIENNRQPFQREHGFSLLEVLIGITLLAISGLAISTSTIHALKTLKLVELNHIANTLAISKIEEIAALDAIEIDSSLNQSESDVTWSGTTITFSRDTAVTINGDDSRTVTVRVDSNNQSYPTSVIFENTFALWE